MCTARMPCCAELPYLYICMLLFCGCVSCYMVVCLTLSLSSHSVFIVNFIFPVHLTFFRLLWYSPSHNISSYFRYVFCLYISRHTCFLNRLPYYCSYLIILCTVYWLRRIIVKEYCGETLWSARRPGESVLETKQNCTDYYTRGKRDCHYTTLELCAKMEDFFDSANSIILCIEVVLLVVSACFASPRLPLSERSLRLPRSSSRW